MNLKIGATLLLGLAASLPLPQSAVADAARGWLSWRGPEQNGVSRETGLPDRVDPAHPLWSAEFPGQSTPVLANGRVYVMGYTGEGPDLQEGVACFDAETGKLLWRRLYSDYLSDTVYLRYATSSPTIDAETGNVYVQGTQGILAAFTADGQPLWSHSMMELYGRLTFPNSRTASPLIDDDLVITRGITANWGTQGPAADRFYAFDKRSGELVWAANPGDRPKDNSFSHPYLTWLQGRRVFFSATGDGSVVCVNARTGEPLWRVPLFRAGINATVLVHNQDKVIAIFGTPYEPGQMVALKIPDLAKMPAEGLASVDRSQVELWSNELSTSTTSPILVGDRIYVVSEKGDLCSVDANNGKILWHLKIGIEQRNACPLFADGKLYVPMLDDPATKTEGGEAGSAGAFYIIKPTDSEGQILSHVALQGRCFGTPTAYDGRIYVQTTQRLYCFGKPGHNPGLPAPVATPAAPPQPGLARQLQIIPSEVLLKPGQTAQLRARTLDANGLTVQALSDLKDIHWASYFPPTAKVRVPLNATFDAGGRLTAATNRAPSAGAFEATSGELKGVLRGRVLPDLPMQQDFEAFNLTETTTNTVENPTPFAYPPLPWIGARFKFEVRERDGTKCLVKTIDNKFFQRATVFIGTPDMKDYTIQADVMSEGRTRGDKIIKMSEVGVINQHYLIVLKGNDQKLEVNSNLERLRVPAVDAPSNFKWRPDIWYRLKARVDSQADGSSVVRAKAWKRDEPEPDAWTIEVPHSTGHQAGSPGLFGFSPQEMRVFIDNVQVTPNS